ncbi:MAG: hypothetical protein MK033_13040 [Candidatus Caenarcaniphilales bacterium]|nr:hypothetical protein [Candidatus Caenarcaniphilales bacterium]
MRAIWPKLKKVNFKTHPYLGHGKDFLREIRIAPNNIDFSMGYWIYNNKVSFISSRKESFGFIIESTELAHMMLAQFNILWETSAKLH